MNLENGKKSKMDIVEAKQVIRNKMKDMRKCGRIMEIHDARVKSPSKYFSMCNFVTVHRQASEHNGICPFKDRFQRWGRFYTTFIRIPHANQLVIGVGVKSNVISTIQHRVVFT